MSADLKSQHRRDEKSLMVRLYDAVIMDVSCILGEAEYPIKEARRDIQTITNRIGNEGFAFATKVLPQLGKAIVSAFQSGRFTTPSTFKRVGGSCALPALLHGLTKHLFTDAGVLRVDLTGVDKQVWGIEQICFLFYKYELPYSDKTVLEKWISLKQVNDELPKTLSDMNLNCEDRTILSLAADIVSEMMAGVDLQYIWPNCGPGSTATGNFSRNAKISKIMSSDMVKGYPKGIYARSIRTLDTGALATDITGSTDDNTTVDTHWDRVSTVHFVPKDSRGPRGISCEPLQNMWIQQGQRREIEAAAHAYSRGRINFRDQTVNGRLALEASKTGEMATLDMKDASDRVSLVLVDLLFGQSQKVLPLLRASRSKFTQFTLPDGTKETIRLNKFAPMGSAVCFPVESIVFWALAVATLRNKKYQFSGLGDLRKRVYVFGDDLIVPSECATLVMDQLERFHLRFNRDKCFTSGPFRESCGIDAFCGEVVTPIKLKTPIPNSVKDASGLCAIKDYQNLFARDWMWNTSFLFENLIAELTGVKQIITRRDLGCFTAFTFSTGMETQPKDERRYFDRTKRKYEVLLTTDRFDPARLQYRNSLTNFQGEGALTYEVRGLVLEPVRSRIPEFDESAGLFDWLACRGNSVLPLDRDALVASRLSPEGRLFVQEVVREVDSPYEVSRIIPYPRIKKRWVTVT